MALQTFAKPTRRGAQCWACGIPEAGEINAGKRAGISNAAIRDWLIREKGYTEEEATTPRIDSHFYQKKHHRLSGPKK